MTTIQRKIDEAYKQGMQEGLRQPLDYAEPEPRDCDGGMAGILWIIAVVFTMGVAVGAWLW